MLSSEGFKMLIDLEGIRLEPYDDQTGKTITGWTKGATIGVGHLISKEDWPKYSKGIAGEEAKQLLSFDLLPFENFVDTLRLEQWQLDALVILCFNIGLQSFKDSTLLKMITDRNYKSVAYMSREEAWKAWNRSQGKKMEGLVTRRNKEWILYSKGVYTY